MRLQVIKHAGFEGPGAIAGWAAAHGHPLAVTELGQGEPLPSLDAFDALVLMGGPMSVNDEGRYAWLKPEKALLREAIAAGKKVLGICLGAQMIASALGAQVRPNAHKEIGWFPVESVAAGEGHPFLAGLPKAWTLLHWHGETYELPKGAVQLWRSAACEQQAFALGTQVLALQCHPEADAASLQGMVEGDRGQLGGGLPYVQSEAEILAGAQRLQAMQAGFERLLENWSAA